MKRHEHSSTAVSDACVVVSVPLQTKRRGGRKQVIIPGDANSGASTQSSTNAPLALTIARAHRWRELLEQGRYRSIRALAQELGVDNSYVARLLRLSLPAPNIIEAVLDGAEPSGLCLEKLYRAPMEWERQRQELGLPFHR